MKFETLKSFNKKKLIIPTVIISCLMIVVTIFVSHSRYVYKDSITIIDDEVNYKPYDFKIIGIYQQKETCTDTSSNNCYEEKEVMPSEGYTINEDKSYCYIDDENAKIKNKVYTNEDGEHVIKELPKRSKCYLYFDKVKPASEKTLDQLAKLTPDLTNEGVIDTNGFTSIETAESTGTVYETKDNDGTSYYYRGDVQDNYVKFGKTGLTESGEDIWWRIIRINGDGSIRMIYAGTSSDGSVPNQKSDATNISVDSKKTFYYATINGLYNNNMYVGYQYTSGIRNGHTTDSYAKTEIDKWFAENLLDEFGDDTKIDKNAGFCVDRQAYSGKTSDTKNDSYGTATQTTYYGSYIRNYPEGRSVGSSNPAHPSLECPDVTNDLLTYEKSDKGTKSLLYPIGLITADEVVYAGGLFNQNNSNYYLYNNSYYWTMSPYYFYGTYAYVFYVDSSGDLYYRDVEGSYELRPVLNLVSGGLTTGTGLSSDPYKVS